MSSKWLLLLALAAGAGCRKSSAADLQVQDQPRPADAPRRIEPPEQVAPAFPLPLPDGVAISGSSSKQDAHTITFLTTKSVDDTAAFYDRLLVEKGFKISRMSLNDADLHMVQIEGKKNRVRTLVTIHNEENQTLALIQYDLKRRR